MKVRIFRIFVFHPRTDIERGLLIEKKVDETRTGETR
jgi:hypothetical protein